jgi:hypothetical protein
MQDACRAAWFGNEFSNQARRDEKSYLRIEISTSLGKTVASSGLQDFRGTGFLPEHPPAGLSRIDVNR